MKNSARAVFPDGVPISVVERATGLSKDLLRTWEKRYGFPLPRRDGTGDRRYDAREVAKLGSIKRLIDAGQRPRHLVLLSQPELDLLLQRLGLEREAPDRRPELDDCLACVGAHDVEGLRATLAQGLLDRGLSGFVRELVAPLNTLIGLEWARGQINVAQEHLYSRAVQAVLHGALAALPPRGQAPSLVMSTVPGEAHALGLLMAEALFTLARCRCLALGIETPTIEIARAARARDADIVALSFSTVLPGNGVRRAVDELRADLPAQCELWLGGSHPVLAQCEAPSIRVLPILDSIPTAVEAWRREHAQDARPRELTSA